MKIVVLEGSPNRHGSSNMLAGEFIRGAKEANHSIEVIDVAQPMQSYTNTIYIKYGFVLTVWNISQK